MLEIGNKSNEYHYRIGELAKDLGIKRLYATGSMTINALDGFLGGEFFNNKKVIAKQIINDLGKNDVVLIKGSRKMELEQIVEYMKVIINAKF
jgi:UDP-N-acetylmuramoyl-tripeptide--D-alanyl-D-alanine ligase